MFEGQEIIIRDWIFECDVEGTRRAYEKIENGSAEDCGCSFCENFAALRPKVFEAESLNILKRLGVDYRKEAETYQVELENSKHLYCFWFHSIGRILKFGTNIELKSGGVIYFLEAGSLSHQNFREKKLIQIEFADLILPWVIDRLPTE